MSDRQNYLSADVTYNSDGEATQLRVFDTDDKIAYVTITNGAAVVRKMYPYPADDAVYGDAAVDVCEYVESLPFVQAVSFGEVDE